MAAMAALLFLLPAVADGAPELSQFFSDNCILCHGSALQKGGVRLDRPPDSLFEDREFLEKVITMLESGDMPPDKAPQPQPPARAQAAEELRTLLAARQEPTVLKRLTRSEYTNTINDLFDADFDLSHILPPDHVESGFDKFGEAHLMSQHQLLAFLKAARFVAERLLPDEKPVQRTWDLDPQNFHGSGRGDYHEGGSYFLSTFYPWRSNLHFSVEPDAYERLIIPEFGRYRFVIQAEAINSDDEDF